MSEGLAASLYKKIPVNLRIIGESLLGSNAPITEKDYSDKDLQFIRQAFLKKRADNNNLENIYRNDLRDGSRMLLGDDGKLVDDTPAYKKDLARAIKSYEDTRGKTSLRYADYNDGGVPQNAGWVDQFKGSFSDNPAHRIATSLGQFNVHEGPDGELTVKDKYNWEGSDANAWEKVSAFASSLSSPEELGNVLMRTFRPNISRDVSIKLPRDVK